MLYLRLHEVQKELQTKDIQLIFKAMYINFAALQ